MSEMTHQQASNVVRRQEAGEIFTLKQITNAARVLAKRCEELEAIVAKQPVDSNGKTISNGDCLYWITRRGKIKKTDPVAMRFRGGGYVGNFIRWGQSYFRDLEDASLAAQQKEQADA